MSRTKPSVQLVADSISDTGTRISTFQLNYWRPILPEMNTHRIFSRNAGSSRAQGFEAKCEEAVSNTFLPGHWNTEQRGMVGGEEFSDEVKDFIDEQITSLAYRTVEDLKLLDNQIYLHTGKRIHKQYLNRYLEPFVGVTQLVTSTDWSNFFKLRLAEDAQPEIKDVAKEIFDLLEHHEPVSKAGGNWHLPYITLEDFEKYGLEICRKISVARCARVSYKAYDGSGDFERDMRLYKRLFESGHMSPFEHVATPKKGNFYNLKNWQSLRNILEAE